MITREHITNLFQNLELISTLAKKYQLDDITLSRPSDRSKEKLHFILSRKEKILSWNELSDIGVELGAILKIGTFEEDKHLIVDAKETFISESMEEVYDAYYSLINKSSLAGVTHFITQELGFDLPQGEAGKNRGKSKLEVLEEKGALSQKLSDSSPENPAIERTRLSEEKVKPSSYSSTLFPTVGRTENGSSLPGSIQSLLQAALEAISKQPKYEAAATEYFLKGLERSTKLPSLTSSE